MRTIKELLILLREYFPKSDLSERGALCFAIRDMRADEGVITADEEDSLNSYIHEKRDRVNGISGATPHVPYFFQEGELAPRLEFLDKLIAEL